jgi:hypothetical protein
MLVKVYQVIRLESYCPHAYNINHQLGFVSMLQHKRTIYAKLNNAMNF